MEGTKTRGKRSNARIPKHSKANTVRESGQYNGHHCFIMLSKGLRPKCTNESNCKLSPISTISLYYMLYILSAICVWFVNKYKCHLIELLVRVCVFSIFYGTQQTNGNNVFTRPHTHTQTEMHANKSLCVS